MQDVIAHGRHFEERRAHRFIHLFRRNDRPRDFLDAFGIGRHFTNGQVRVFLARRREGELEWFVDRVDLGKLGRVFDLHDRAIGFSNWNPCRFRLGIDLERKYVGGRERAFANAENRAAGIVAEFELRSRAVRNGSAQFFLVVQKDWRSL